MNVQEKINCLLSEINRLRYPEILELKTWEIQLECSKNHRQVVTIPTVWGGYDQTVWWQKKVTLPPTWTGQKMALRMDIPEGLVFLNNQPYQGIDTNHQEIILPERITPEFTLEIQAYSGRKQELNECKFSELVIINPPADKLYTWLEHLLAMSDHYIWVAKSLENLVKYVTDHELNIDKLTEQLLNNIHTYLESKVTPEIHLIGHSHIDVVWLWTLKETRRKLARTFTTSLNLIQEFSEFLFMQGQAQLYAYFKQDYPELYQQIQHQVQSGRWQIEGAVWVEPDGNLINGESWVRQLVYGQRFFQEEFGVTCQILWLPDTFGYQGNLPQILKQSGVNYFFTTKLNWNDTGEFPLDSFWWQGIDGSKVLAHQPPVGLEGLLSIKDLEKTGQNYQQNDIAPVVLQTFGYGDGGGGVTRKHLQIYELTHPHKLPFPHYISHPLRFFQMLEQYSNYLPVWPGELYLEKHRGTYTTHSRVKQLHRQAERELYVTELLATLSWLNNHSYPQELLEQTWKLLLLQQFHDILPGTFIPDAYPQILQDFAQIFANLASMRQQVIKNLQITLSHPYTWTVFNPIHTQENVYLVLTLPELNPELNPHQIALKVNGQTISHQVLNEHTAIINEITTEVMPRSRLPSPPAPLPEQKRGENQNGATPCDPCFTFKKDCYSLIPSLYPESQEQGIKILCAIPQLNAHSITEIQLEYTPDSIVNENDINITNHELENDYLKLTFNAQGNLLELWDKRLQKNILLPDRPGGEIKLFLDHPKQWEAWDIDADYATHPSPDPEFISAQIIEQGKLRSGVAFTYEIRNHNGLNCQIKKSIYLYQNCPWIEFYIDVDLTHNQYAPFVMKILFPFDLDCDQATFDIPFGVLSRSTRNPVQFEVPALSWADLSGDNWGVSLISRDKYGFNVTNNTIGLTLLRVAHYPHPIEPWHLTDTEITDKGTHQFCFRLYPHSGTFVSAKTVHQAQEFLYQPIVFPSNLRPFTSQIIKCNAPNLVITCIKKAMDCNGIIIRIYEAYGQDVTAEIQPQIPIQEIWECNLLEHRLNLIPALETFTVDFSEFMLKTFLLVL
ncbi:MAG: glycoside hydrolase family 38 C-terminal domain-containing protein [Gloeomargarita sp. HHBFW_bins_162]